MPNQEDYLDNLLKEVTDELEMEGSLEASPSLDLDNLDLKDRDTLLHSLGEDDLDRLLNESREPAEMGDTSAISDREEISGEDYLMSLLQESKEDDLQEIHTLLQKADNYESIDDEIREKSEPIPDIMAEMGKEGEPVPNKNEKAEERKRAREAKQEEKRLAKEAKKAEAEAKKAAKKAEAEARKAAKKAEAEAKKAAKSKPPVPESFDDMDALLNAAGDSNEMFSEPSLFADMEPEESASEPALDSDLESASEPTLDSALEPASESDLDSNLEPASEPDLDSVLESASEPDLDSVLESASEPDLDSVLESASEPDLDSVLESASEPDLDSVLESASEPAFDSILESAFEPPADTEEPSSMEADTMLNESEDESAGDHAEGTADDLMESLEQLQEDKSPKKGFFAKILDFIMEEDEDEEEEKGNEDIQLSDENQAILEDMDKEKKGKKKGKKDKKGKKGKGAEAAEGADAEGEEDAEGDGKGKKPKKAKKPKKEKEPQPAEPGKKLSKKRVLLIVAVCATLTAVILILTNISSEYSTKRNGRKAYYDGDYQTCYQELYGKKLSESEQVMYNKSECILKIRLWLKEYEILAGEGDEVKALDNLIQSVNSYPELYDYALQWNSANEVAEVHNQMVAILADKYHLSLEQALAIAAEPDDIEYTKQVTAVAQGGTPDSYNGTVENQEDVPLKDVLPEEEGLNGSGFIDNNR